MTSGLALELSGLPFGGPGFFTHGAGFALGFAASGIALSRRIASGFGAFFPRLPAQVTIVRGSEDRGSH